MCAVGSSLAAALLSAPAPWRTPPDYSANLFGDLGGFREAFAKVGGTLQATETSEVFANPTGGLKRGANYDGLTTVTVQVDTKAAFNWEGGPVQRQPAQSARRQLHALAHRRAADDIAAFRATGRHGFGSSGTIRSSANNFDVRFGQQSLDVEFTTSPSGAYLRQFAVWLAGAACARHAAAAAPPSRSPRSACAGAGSQGPWTALGGVFSGEPARRKRTPTPARQSLWRKLSAQRRARNRRGAIRGRTGRGRIRRRLQARRLGRQPRLSPTSATIHCGQPLADPAGGPDGAHAPRQFRRLRASPIRWCGAARKRSERSTCSCARPSRRSTTATSSASASTAAWRCTIPCPAARTTRSASASASCASATPPSASARMPRFYNPGVYTPQAQLRGGA